MNWAEIIKEYRVKNGLLQKQLAYDFGVDVMTVSRWERGISEPSKIQKGRIKDLVTARKCPASHPHLDNMLSFSNALLAIDLVSERCMACNDDAGLFQLNAEEVIGQNPSRFITHPVTQEGFDYLGGYAGIIEKGLMAYSYTVDLTLNGRMETVQYITSVLNLDGYNPVLVQTRHVTDAKAAQTLADVTFQFEDELPVA